MATTITGKLLYFDQEPNLNGRIYTKECIEKIVEKFGELDHPMYGEIGYPTQEEVAAEAFAVNLSKSSHRVNKIEIPKHRLPRKKKKEYKKIGIYDKWRKSMKYLLGHIEILDNDNGKIAESFLENCVFRPRAIGTVNENKEVEIEQLISFDLVKKEEDSFKNIIDKQYGNTKKNS